LLLEGGQGKKGDCGGLPCGNEDSAEYQYKGSADNDACPKHYGRTLAPFALLAPLT
jgi:hypothetical protein